MLKNAIDYVAHVFAKKPAAYVGYGGVGAARAIEQLRLINIEQQMAPLKSAVHIGGADFVDVLKNGKSLADKAHLVPSVNAMVEELAWWSRSLASHEVVRHVERWSLRTITCVGNTS